MRGVGCGWGFRVGALAPSLLLTQIVTQIVTLLGCGPSASELRAADPRPNLVVISMDTTRADHLSVHGYERDTSPSLRRLAEQGVLFETAYAPSATTGPSHASLFTSLYPLTHRVVKNGQPLKPELETLAEILERVGFDTAAVVSSYVLSARFGYDQGFANFDDDFSRASVPSGVTLWEGEEVEGKFYGSADDTTRRALEWLDERPRPEHPFFLFVHYFDPHDPYQPPPDYTPPFAPGRKEQLKLNRQIFLYDLLIAFTDQEIGRLIGELDARGLGRETIVVVTGDHGEGLMQHGHMFHGAQIYEEGVRVPLVMRWPDHIDAGQKIDRPVQLMDLAPTLLELMGEPQPDAMQGLSLVALLQGRDDLEPERPIFLYRRHYEGEEIAEGVHVKGEKLGMRVGRWKLIDGPEEESLELFDLEADPEERVNLAEREPERVAGMRLRLRRFREAQARGDARPVPLSDEDRKRLEALGYVE